MAQKLRPTTIFWVLECYWLRYVYQQTRAVGSAGCQDDWPEGWLVSH